MDEMVWVVIGIISVFVGVGIVGSLLLQGQQSASGVSIDSALDRLANHCNQVCRLPVDTASSTSVQLPRNTLLYVDDDLLCAQQEGDVSCRRCNCVISGELLNLTGAPFVSHAYSCRFTKDSLTSVFMECQG